MRKPVSVEEIAEIEARDILSIAKTAIYLDKSVQTVYREIADGKLEAVEIRGDMSTTREGRQKYLRNLTSNLDAVAA